MLYFEDIKVGDSKESIEEYELQAEEIIAYCKKWDPLPFHTNEEAAAASPVGKLFTLSLIHISEPTRRRDSSRMPSSA